MSQPACQHCGGANAAPFRDDRLLISHLCPPCAHTQVLWKAAYQQLLIQTRDVVRGWAYIWGSVEGMASIPELFEWLGDDLEAERLAGKWNA